MVDKFSTEIRSRIMRAIPAHNTKPEIIVRSIVHRMGFRFRVHRHDLPGRPDLVLTRHHKVIFVHGCFWHSHSKCQIAHTPKSNQHYWLPKLERTTARDAKNKIELERLGWKTLTVWECEVKNTAKLRDRLKVFIGQAPEIER